MDKRVLITGACGFIGSHLARTMFQEGWEVSAVEKEAANLLSIQEIKDKIDIFYYRDNIRELIEYFHKVKPRLVIHLASVFTAEHDSEDIVPLIASNILFGTHILEAMKYSDTKYMINTGTSWQHYENESYNPVCLYAATKKAFEDILVFYEKSAGIKSLTLKLFDTYGPDDYRKKLFDILRKSAKEHSVLKMSKGEQYLDLVYIDDVIEAYKIAIQIIENDRGGPPSREYAVSSEKHIKLKELINAYNNLSENKVSVEWGAKPYRVREVMVPWTEYRLLPGWTAKTTLEDGILRLLSQK